MNNFKRILSCLLIICFMVSLAPAAFAAEDQTEPVNVSAWDGETESETYGDITIDSENTALDVAAVGGGSASVVVEGDVTADAAGGPPHMVDYYDENGNVAGQYEDLSRVSGLQAYADGNGSEAQVEIQGDVSAAIGEGEAFGIGINAYEEGTASVSVGGNVEDAGCCGTAVSAYSFDGNASVEVENDVSFTAVAPPEGDDTYWSSTGVSATSVMSGNAEVTVGGDVTVTTESSSIEANGVTTEVRGNSPKWDEETQSFVYVELGPDDPAGSSSVTVEGSVNVSGNDYAAGVHSEVYGLVSSEVTVGGDVSVESKGVYANGVNAYGNDGSSAAITVGGDVSAEGAYGTAVEASSRNDSDVSIKIEGDVSAEGSSGLAVELIADDGDASVEIGGDVALNVTGDLESDDNYWRPVGINSQAYFSGTAETTVGGDVIVVSEGDLYGVDGVNSEAEGYKWVWDEETQSSVRIELGPDDPAGSSSVTVEGSVDVSGQESATGVYANAYGPVSSEVTIGGDISAASKDRSATGVNAYSYDCGSAKVTVDGDVSAKGKTAATGVLATGYGSGSAAVNVGGDVSAEGEAEATGISAHAGDGCAITVIVDGDVSAEGKFADGIFTTLSGEDSSIDVRVNGDVTGSSTGLTIFLWGEDDESSSSSLSITVDGTISGGEKSITASGKDVSPVALTVWKVDLDEDGNAVTPRLSSIDDIDIDPSDEYYDELKSQIEKENEQNTALAEALEESILFIIRLVQPDAGGTLSLSGTTQSDGFDVAKEGDNVVLLISVADGYQIDAAYNGEGEKVELQKDSDGNYYLVVPKGGGVSLSAELSKIPVVYRAPAAPAKKIVAQTGDTKLSIEPTVKDENGNGVTVKVQVIFYDDNTFDIIMGEGAAATHIRGSYKLVDGVLTLVLKDGSEIKIGDDGILIIPLPTGNTLEIKLDQAAIDALVKAAK